MAWRSCMIFSCQLSEKIGRSPDWEPRTASPHAGCFLLQLLRLVVGDESINDGLKLAVHHVAQLVQGQPDAVVGHTVLRKIVGADLFAAVAAAHHGPPLLGQLLLLLL